MLLNLFIKLAEKYYDKNQNISIDHERCIHKVKEYDCLKCISTCRNNGLEYFEDKLIISENCIGCGSCIEVCPTGAISDPLQTGPLRFNGEPKDILEISCEKDGRVYGVKAKCVFTIGLHQLVEIHSRTGKKLCISTGKCQECSRFSEQQLKHKQLEMEDKISGLPAIISDKGVNPDETAVSREELFKILGDNTSNRILAATNKIKAKNLKHALLSKYLKGCSQEDYYLSMILGREFTESCKLCGKCARLCPTNSILLTEVDDKVSLNYDYLECIDCNRCIDHCHNSGIVSKKGKLSNRKEITGKTCSVCGQVARDHICRTCRDKRKV